MRYGLLMTDLAAQHQTPLGELIGEVRMGRLSRRRFVRTMVGLGLSAPIAAHLLGSAGLSQTRPAAQAPARRGGGGPLRLLYWQAATPLPPPPPRGGHGFV